MYFHDLCNPKSPLNCESIHRYFEEPVTNLELLKSSHHFLTPIKRATSGPNHQRSKQWKISCAQKSVYLQSMLIKDCWRSFYCLLHSSWLPLPSPYSEVLQLNLGLLHILGHRSKFQKKYWLYAPQNQRENTVLKNKVDSLPFLALQNDFYLSFYFRSKNIRRRNLLIKRVSASRNLY